MPFIKTITLLVTLFTFGASAQNIDPDVRAILDEQRALIDKNADRIKALEALHATKPEPEPEPDPGPEPMPDPPSGTGWTKLGLANTFRSVWPAKEDAPEIWGKEGPSAVLSNWTGAGFDPVNRCWYFHGGGHGGYFGNEVYRLCLETRTWERLSNPSRIVDENGVPFPRYGDTSRTAYLTGPASTHTYDGTWFQDGKLYVVATSTFESGYWKYDPASKGLWAFDVASRTWERVQPLGTTLIDGVGRYLQLTYTRTARIGDKVLISGGEGEQAIYDPATNSFSNYQRSIYRGAQITNFENIGGTIFSVTYPRELLKFPATSRPGGDKSKPKLGLWYTAGIQEKDGVLYILSGGGSVVTYDTATGTWGRQIETEGPSSVMPLSKWTRVGETFYVVDNAGDLWRWTPTGDSGEPVLDISSLFIEQAMALNPVPKAVYKAPGLVDRPVDVDFNGSQLIGKTEGIAPVVVAPGADGAVLKNFMVLGGDGAVRDRSNQRLTIEGATVKRVMQGLLLTGNGGTGQYIIRNSTVRDAARGTPGRDHNVYIGTAESVVADGLQSLGHPYLGHLFKSRARNTTIINSTLDGLETNHSRIIDWNPEGSGVLLIENSTLRVSPNADNADVIAACRESSCYGAGGTHRVVIRNSVIDCSAKACKFSNSGSVAWEIDDVTKGASIGVTFP